MLQILGIILFLILTLLPQYWVKKVFAKNRQNLDNIQGTGAEFTKHLLQKLSILKVKVIEQKASDYYDPVKKVIALSPQNYHGKSLCAVVIAAHEVGHAMQDYSGSILLRARFFLLKIFQSLRVISTIMLMITPFLFAFRPISGLFALLFYLGASLINIIIHFCTLPLEWDASFLKALPMLKAGKYISKKQIPLAQEILKAAALTYLATALNNIIFSIFQWRGWIRK